MSDTNGRVEKLQKQLDEAYKLAEAEEELVAAKNSGDVARIKKAKAAAVEATQRYRAQRANEAGSLILIPPTLTSGVSSVN